MSKSVKHQVPFAALFEAARLQNWEFVERHLNGDHLSQAPVDWAMGEGLFHTDQNIRDLAVSVLDASDLALTPLQHQTLEHVMLQDKYHIVQYRAAIALFKRKHRTNVVLETMARATHDPDVGELALIHLNGK